MSDPKNAKHRVSIKIICKSKNKILLIKQHGKETYNLVGGGIDQNENIIQTIKREFEEETGNIRQNKNNIKIIDAEIIQYDDTTIFNAALNLFYIVNFKETFTVTLENIYETYGRFTKKEIENIPISIHSKKDLLLSILS